MKRNFYLLFASFALLLACNDVPENNNIIKNKLIGTVQKGPFINGTSIVVSELDENYSLTGKTFDIQILDNSGHFELKNAELKSTVVQLKASGYYFNEVTGKQSVSPINLFALADINSKDSVCVNVLTHLEKSRIEYLVTSGLSYSEASIQAHTEVMDVFGFDESSGVAADQMNITGANDRDAILLATSVILQAYRTEGELSELLADIVTDMREDGILNSEGIYQTLINQAVLLNLDNIRLNLVERYAALGMTVHIPDFEYWVNSFIENSEFDPQNGIEYPVNTIYGDNILNESIDTIKAWEFYSMSAELPAGNSLHIRLSGSSWAYLVMPDAPINWDADNYNGISKTQNFYSIEKGKNCMLKIEFYVDESHKESGETVTIEYFENGSENLTKTKHLHVKFALPV